MVVDSGKYHQHSPLLPSELRFWQTTEFMGAVLTVCLVALGLSLRLAAKLALQTRAQQLLDLERVRIARDIHDDLGAALTQLVLQCEVAQTEYPEESTARVHFSQFCARTRAASQALDEVVWAVNSKRDTLRDFSSYLCKYAQTALSNTPIRCRLDIQSDMPTSVFDLSVRRGLLLAVKESLNNAAKHSESAELLLCIYKDDEHVVVIVQDQGKGFDPDLLSGERNGLQNMVQRLEELGGTCRITSAINAGCRVEFRMPLAHPAAHGGSFLVANLWPEKCRLNLQLVAKWGWSTTFTQLRIENKAPAFSAESPLRIALVEDKRDVRESWAKLINSFPDFICMCKCASAEDALRMLPPLQPNVILMDIFLPRMSGIECTARLKNELPKTPIVMLTASDDDELVFVALQAGADGYLLKRTTPADLRSALIDVLTGGAPMSSEIARRVVESFRQPSRGRDNSISLTAREEETLLLLSKGYSNKEIADRLGLGIETVRSHLNHIYEKMHVRSRAGAVASTCLEKRFRIVEWPAVLRR